MAKYLQVELYVRKGKSAAPQENRKLYKFSGAIHGCNPNIEALTEELRIIMAEWLISWLRYDQVRIEMEDHIWTFE